MTRKIVEGARSGLNSLLDKILADETPLSGVERDELDAEQERRIQARQAGNAPPPEDNPRARWAGAGDEATGRRKQAADVREQRIRRTREEKRKADETAREAEWQRFQAEARRQAADPGHAGAGSARSAGSGPSSSSRPSSSSSRPSSSSSSRTSSSHASSGGRRPGAGFGGIGPRNEKIARYYKVLDLPYGADFEQVKASYRKLMRKYHPDLHAQTPQKAKAATELTMQVTQAYNELENYLSGGPNKKP